MALKVLLADDSMTAQNMGKKILTDAGFDVLTVSNGAAAIKKVAEYKPNIIILDIYMPGYTGLEVCERVRATDGTTPILLTVGKLEPFRQEDIEHVHADAIIIKPFEATDLINAVQKYADQADLAASKAPVPPPAPSDEVPPPPPPAQLSEEDLAFLRGEVQEQTPEPPASNAGQAAATNPDFAELLAAPQASVSPTEGDIPLNDFELPPLTEADFAMLQDGASAESVPAYQDTSAAAEPAIDTMAAPGTAESAPIPETESPEMPAFQLDEDLAAPQGDVPAVSAYGAAPIFAPTESAPVLESAPVADNEPVAEVAMAAAATPTFEPAAPVYFDAAPTFTAEPEHADQPVYASEPQEAAQEFALELPTEPAAEIPTETLIEPILNTAPAAEVAEVVPPVDLEPLELEQSGPQATSESVAPPEELAPTYEFIGATGKTPVDTEIESLPIEPVVGAESAVFAEPELLETPHHEPLVPEAAPVVAFTEAATPLDLDLNYATVAGVVHRVFDRYKSQMIADIVRELSEKQK